MRWRKIVPAAVVVCTLLAGGGCNQGQDAPGASAPPAPNPATTATIQKGIESHIQEQVHLGGGYFKLPFRNQELRLKLVRVHTEYLSKLGPRRYFACVDLVDISGDVYDVDFFLAGQPEAMQVIETTVHKINGQPFYAWEQKSDGTWHRIPMKKASAGHLGVIKGSDEFEFVYRAVLPEITGTGRMWLPLAASDSFQAVEIKSINAPGKQSILEEREHGNKVLFLELGPEFLPHIIHLLERVERHRHVLQRGHCGLDFRESYRREQTHVQAADLLAAHGDRQ